MTGQPQPADASGPGAGPDGAPRFEEALARLEGIVQALESGNLSLEDSLRAFEEGTGLLRQCAQKLDDVERRIEILMRDEGGVRAQRFLPEDDSQ